MYVMNKILFNGVMTTLLLVSMSLTTFLNAQTLPSSLKANSAETFIITSVPAKNGSYTISPKIGEDGKVPAGTLLTIKAKPAPGYSMDAVYYTVKGGIWGTTSYESFSKKMKISVTKDMKVGASFIPRSLVDNVKVSHDIIYAKPGVKPLKYD